MLLLRVNTYSISDIYMLCWECIGASIYGLGAGRSLPNLYQAHKLRSCHLSHLPSNTESEHSTAPGSADRPGGNGVHLHTTVGDRHPAVFANVITNTQTQSLESTCSIMKSDSFEAALKTASLSQHNIYIIPSLGWLYFAGIGRLIENFKAVRNLNINTHSTNPTPSVNVNV